MDSSASQVASSRLSQCQLTRPLTAVVSSLPIAVVVAVVDP
jgi:hypothetical protein